LLGLQATPASLWAETVPPGRHLSCTRLLLILGGPQLISPSSFLGSLRRAFFLRVHQMGRPLCDFWPRSGPASLGLHATPEFIATQSVLVACPSYTRIPTFRRSRAVILAEASISICAWFSRLACAYRPGSALTSARSVLGRSQSAGCYACVLFYEAETLRLT